MARQYEHSLLALLENYCGHHQRSMLANHSFSSSFGQLQHGMLVPALNVMIAINVDTR